MFTYIFSGINRIRISYLVVQQQKFDNKKNILLSLRFNVYRKCVTEWAEPNSGYSLNKNELIL